MKIKIKEVKLSVLMFRNKVKVSGGTSSKMKHELSPKRFERRLKRLIRRLCREIEIDGTETMRISLINANMKLTPINNFLEWCENTYKKEKIYAEIKMPLSNIRGRIGAIKIYPFEKSKMSVHFDKGGYVQFFGFKCVEVIHFMSQMIQNDISGNK